MVLISIALFLAIAAAELIKELKESETKAALDLLNKAKATCAGYGITAEGMTEIGDPKVAISDAAAELNIQLLVVGSHGRGAVTRLVSLCFITSILTPRELRRCHNL
ncbi:putative rossmann-like alpha/beta/alpha sandwich protein [Helianthus annuus]|nr:putative rossmann-like alpha/beta/alpha sandwich protein [Helianthus annuus]KAJ0646625.1 putative rossmann-like alpha/beta/alpha sandwich protein [Helianthus annuus]